MSVSRLFQGSLKHIRSLSKKLCCCCHYRRSFPSRRRACFFVWNLQTFAKLIGRTKKKFLIFVPYLKWQWKSHNDHLKVHIWLHIQLYLVQIPGDVFQKYILSRCKTKVWISHRIGCQYHSMHYLFFKNWNSSKNV